MGILSEKDLIGQLEGFPLDVVQKMLEEQKSHTGKVDVSVFQRGVDASSSGGGFDWGRSSAGRIFWDKVIRDKDFEHFYIKYPSGGFIPQTLVRTVLEQLTFCSNKNLNDLAVEVLQYMEFDSIEYLLDTVIGYAETDEVSWEMLVTVNKLRTHPSLVKYDIPSKQRVKDKEFEERMDRWRKSLESGRIKVRVTTEATDDHLYIHTTLKS
jgi:hypothetical protein